jgi:hypothetical protein
MGGGILRSPILPSVLVGCKGQEASDADSVSIGSRLGLGPLAGMRNNEHAGTFSNCCVIMGAGRGVGTTRSF